jgi:hypothetical protein
VVDVLTSRVKIRVRRSKHTGQPLSLVGREAELARLHQWWRLACQGARQMGFVTGGAGVGKTALVEAFVKGLGLDERPWVGYGQWLEPYGVGEAYLPLLEALGRLCLGADGESLLAMLRQHAPSWLVQMPTLLPPAERGSLQRLANGMTPVRMLRELAEAVEVLTVDRPLIVVLEDLHWSDVSTLDWLAYVARRRGPARLLVMGTYRPVETLRREHPLRTITQELQEHRQCHVLEVADLSPTGVAAYLTQRFGGNRSPGTCPGCSTGAPAAIRCSWSVWWTIWCSRGYSARASRVVSC